MEEKPECNDECDPKRTGPFTLAEDSNRTDKTRKAPFKCEKCGKEWYEYF